MLTNDQAFELGKSAAERHRETLEQMQVRYRERCVRVRGQHGWRPLCIVGHGRSGKDLACDLIRRLALGLGPAGLTFAGSTSLLVAPLIAKDLQLTTETAYSQRHQNRMLWYHWSNGLRHHDPGLLARMALADGDLVCGLRDFAEIEAVRAMVRWVIWIENPRVDQDPTVAFGPEDCDFVVWNAGSRREYAQTWRRLWPVLFPNLEKPS